MACRVLVIGCFIGFSSRTHTHTHTHTQLLVDENDYGDDSGEEVHIGAVQVRDLEEEEVSDSSEEELEEEEVHEYDPSTS